MATTKIKTIRKTLKLALDYIQNGDKTNEKILVKGINCSPETAYNQFQAVKQNHRRPDGKLAFHVIQSFKPGEVDYDTAHKIGLELADRVLKGKYKVVVATHVDKEHIHNHLIFNSVSHIDGKKYNDCKKTYYQLRDVSDQLCKEHGLSIVEPKSKGLHYKEWSAIKEGNSWKAMMKNDIDAAIKNCSNYNEFVKAIKQKGYEVKEGKHLAFRHKGYKRFVRGKTLGVDFTLEGINARISLKNLGINTITFKSGSKKYNVKDLDGKKFYFKNKSLLEINIQLGIKIIMLLLKKYPSPKTTRSKYIKKYNEAVVDKLSEQLSLVGEYKITDDKKLAQVADVNDKKLVDTREKMKESDKRMNFLTEAVNLINIMQKNQQYRKKKLFDKAHDSERQAYKLANDKLNKMGINYNDDKNRVLMRLKKEQEKIQKLKIQYNKCKSRKTQLNELQNTIKKVQNREYPYGRETKNKNKQKNRQMER